MSATVAESSVPRGSRAPLAGLLRPSPGIIIKSGDSCHAQRYHAHREWSLAQVLAGSTVLLAGNEELYLAVGDYAVVPPGLAHLCQPQDQDFGYRVLYLTCEHAARLGDVNDGTLRQGKPGPDERARLDMIFIDLGKSLDQSRLWGALQDLARAIRESSVPRELAVRPVELCSGLCSPSSVPTGASTCTEPQDRSPSRYQDYRQSRRLYGLGRHGLEQIRRVEQAKALLESGCRVADVAAACGFCDQSHLDKTFRLYTGLCPSAWQQARIC